MARNQPAWVNWSQYLGLRTVAGVLHCFDIDQILAISAEVGSLFHHFSKRHRTRAIDNLRASFPSWTEDQIESMARRSIQNMFQLFLVDALVMPRLVSETSWPRYVRFGKMSSVLERMLRGKPAIFITGHCGNWEFLGFSLAVMGFPMHAVSRPLDNPLLNDWLLGIREARGMRIITKWGATPVLQETLEHGGRIAFIADQNAGEGGLFVPFFGRLASSYKSIGLLAMHYEVPIIAGFARRIDGKFLYEVAATDVIEPKDWKDRSDPLFYITARYNRAMEMMIRDAPEQYLWVHRRWKSRPRHERLGRAMPPRLREKIHALPWLDADEADSIIETSDRNARANR